MLQDKCGEGMVTNGCHQMADGVALVVLEVGVAFLEQDGQNGHIAPVYRPMQGRVEHQVLGVGVDHL